MVVTSSVSSATSIRCYCTAEFSREQAECLHPVVERQARKRARES
jgi:hypothetical protein